MPALGSIIITSFSQSCTPAGGRISFVLRATPESTGVGLPGETPGSNWSVSYVLRDTASGDEAASGIQPGLSASFTVDAIPNGEYELQAESFEGYSARTSVSISCAPATPPPGPGPDDPDPDPGPEPTNPDPRCEDTDADNYGSTENGGLCLYSDRLTCDELPELVANGSEVLVTLRSTEVAGTPARAQVLIQFVSRVPDGAELQVNGHTFTYGALTRSDRFNDAASLLAALEAVPTLAGAYEITQPTGDAVRLVAHVEGHAGTITASTTHEAQLAVTVTAGQPRYQSQKRAEWGCYCEVWVQCGTSYGGATSKATAVRAARFEARLRDDNTYTFDIAAALREYTAHRFTQAAGRIPDRMVSYFVRFGEIYADSVGGFRRRRNVYETRVLWALEACEVPAESLPGVRVLSAQPVRRAGLPLQLAYLLLTEAAADELSYRVALTDYAGVTTTSEREALPGVALPDETPPGGVYCLPYAFDELLQVAELGFSRSSADTNLTVATVQLLPASTRAVEFANRQGGFDTFAFTGVREDSLRRTPASYQAQAGEQLRVVELELPVKLYSGLLDAATWHWLRTELAASPSARVAGVPVVITDVDTPSNPLEGEYSISIEYKSAPIRGLSN